MDIGSITRGPQFGSERALTEYAQNTVRGTLTEGSGPPGRGQSASAEKADAVQVADRSVVERDAARQLTALRSQSGSDLAATTAKISSGPTAAGTSVAVATGAPMNTVARGLESLVAAALKGRDLSGAVDNSVHRHQGVVEPTGVTGNGSPVVEGVGFDIKA
ncbi:MAG: hypothetical protein QG608_1581 [Actinomycetota bacterium]|nr:hypothetical protein [Actinomycetota bacterium]